MATVIRGPLISTPPKVRNSAVARDFQQQNFVALTAVPPAVPAPGLQQDWPSASPKLRKDSARARDYLFVNDLPRALEGPFPYVKQEWPPPLKPKPKAVETINPGVELRVAPPYSVTNWPNPPRKDNPRARDQAFITNLNLVNQPTFRLGDWTLPARRDSPRSCDYVFVNDLARALETYPPFWNYDWPRPARRDSPRARDYWFNNDLARSLEGPFPYASPNWPSPFRERPQAGDSISGTIVSEPIVVSPPYSVTEWSIAFLRDRRAPDFQVPNTTLYQPAPDAIPPGSGQMIAANPTRARSVAAADATLVNTTPIQPPPDPGGLSPEYIYYARHRNFR